MKYCPNCNSEIDDNYDLCWNCQYSFNEKRITSESEYTEQCVDCDTKDKSAYNMCIDCKYNLIDDNKLIEKELLNDIDAFKSRDSKSKFKFFIKYGIAHFFILTFFMFLRINGIEKGDSNTNLYALIFFTPIILIIANANIYLIAISLYLIKKNKYKWISALFSSFIITITYIILMIKKKLNIMDIFNGDFIYLNIIFIVMNLITVIVFINPLKEK